MSDNDWRDPFSDDEAARERARRRAEREQRRREQRRQLADRVREDAEQRPAAPEPREDAKQRPAAPEPREDAEQRPAAPESPARPRPPTGESKALVAGERTDSVVPPSGGAPGGEDPARPPSGGASEGDDPASPDGEPDSSPEAPPTGEHPAHTEEGEAISPGGGGPPRRPRRGRGRRAPSTVLLRRRLAAIGLLVAAVGLVFFGAATVADRLGGSAGEEETAPATEAEPDISVTIPEGLDRRQIATIANDAGLRGNYAKASRQAKGFNPGNFGAENPDSLEGFLFPATYDLRPNANVNVLVRRQLDAFREQVSGVNMGQARSRGLNVYDVLKIASMIEREVQIPEERRLVASVIYNRLAAGNPLGIDATIRYEDGNFEEPLTESRLAEPTPYNTRVNAGLPPTPIGNPGLATIRAAANPADTDHFYYVVKPNTCGEHFFTASEEEFQNAANEYQQALEEQGGAPTPDDC